jgi:PleD family two-component response regulator
VGILKSSRKSSTDLLAGKEAFQQAIAKERYRADRSNNEYSLLILSLAVKSKKNKRIVGAIAEIRERIRAIDEIGWYEENQLGIILPFTAMDGADRLADEICEIITAHLKPEECLACELFSYDPESVPEAEMPKWKKNLKA